MDHRDRYRKIRRTSRLIAVVLACSMSLSGCAVGYMKYDTKALDIPSPTNQSHTQDLSGARVSYLLPKGEALLQLSLEKILRAQYGIRDLRAKAEHEASGRFLLSVEAKQAIYSPFEYGNMVTSFLTLAVIPMAVSGEHAITFTLETPGGERTSYSYQYNENTYSWLPFLFLNPDFNVGINGGYEGYQPQMIALNDALVSRFMRDAAPFMQSSLRTGSRPSARKTGGSL